MEISSHFKISSLRGRLFWFSSSPSPLNACHAYYRIHPFNTWCTLPLDLCLHGFIASFTDLFEGDMVMDARLRSWVTGQYDKRDAINDDTYLWPKSQEGHVRVPYRLSDEIMEGKKTYKNS